MAKGMVTFNSERCKGCELCVSVCPVKIIELDRTTTNSKGYNPSHISETNKEKCIGCAQCGLMCPDSVITVERN
ncbi:MAG TPA: 2-oxoacid:acceptor oxidoreductase [Fusobacteriaceae bacterium]|nr:2-oxoacid:acceptor oxidoreductase [Fusobacteriaceae bacterium]